MKLFFAVIAIILSSPVFATPKADDIVGIWSNSSNKAHIQIYKLRDRFYGKIIWLRNPNDATGKPKIDKKNPDEKNRKNRIMGLVVLKNFKFDEEEWNGGKIYNPEDGKEYKSIIRLRTPEELSVRGFIGFSFIGKTEKFTRVK